MLRLIRQRWSIENEWHWARDAQLGEDAHRYANRTGVAATARSGRACVSSPTTSRECWRWEA